MKQMFIWMICSADDLRHKYNKDEKKHLLHCSSSWLFIYLVFTAWLLNAQARMQLH